MPRRPTGGIHAGPVALAALARYNASKADRPKCGAKRRNGAGICASPALANGRCRWHGGRTPSGDDWHKARWPKASDPREASKFAAKIRALEKRAKARAARLAQMTPEEIAAYRKWHAERPVGPAARRAEMKAQSAAASRLFERTAPTPDADPEYLAICARIKELKSKLAEINREGPTAPFPYPTDGVFG